jgi:hypothetical protein
MSSSTPVIHLNSRLPALLSLVIRPVAVTLGRHVFVRRGVDPTDVLLRQYEREGRVRRVPPRDRRASDPRGTPARVPGGWSVDAHKEDKQ